MLFLQSFIKINNKEQEKFLDTVRTQHFRTLLQAKQSKTDNAVFFNNTK